MSGIKNISIPFFTPAFHYFKTFFYHSGKVIFLFCIISILAVITEGIGISLILPVLSFSDTNTEHNQITDIVYNLLQLFDIKISLISLLSVLVVTFFLKSVFVLTQAVILSYLSTNLLKTLRIKFCDLYSSMTYIYYTRSNVGYLNNIITTECNRFVYALISYSNVVVSIIFIFGYMIFVLLIDWKLTLLTIVFTLCVFLMFSHLIKKTKLISILRTKTNAQVQSLMIQYIANIKYLKATNSFSPIFKKLSYKIDRNRQYEFQNGIMSSIIKSIVEPIAVLFLSLIILYNVDHLNKSIVNVLVLSLFFYRAFTRMLLIQSQWQGFISSVGSVEVIRESTRDLTANKEPIGKKEILGLESKIEFKKVKYCFGKKEVIKGIDLVIPKDKIIGIVGESGAGKTTLFDLITGLLSPDSGTITINGFNYKDINIPSLRQLFGYVTQEPVVFNDSIANNISLWDANKQSSEVNIKVKSAAELSYCDFINDSTDKYDTVIGDKGIRLSGGQKQRLAIAREIYKKPEILILDEATSSLDTDSENFLQKSINAMKGGQTLILISHRLSTIKICDYVYVLSSGKIVEEGTFNDLYNKDQGLFKKMCIAQKV